MSLIKTLPLLPGAKFIVIDDCSDVSRGSTLINGWLQMFHDKGLGNAVEYLLFSNPPNVHDNLSVKWTNIELKYHDYYTIFVEDDKREEAKKLDRIITGNILRINSIVIIDCLSTIVLNFGLSKALQFVDKLSSRTAQLLCVYRRDFGDKKIPRIDTLGSTYVKIEKTLSTVNVENSFIRYNVTINHRKQGGGILHHRATVSQEYDDSYEIVDEKIDNITAANSGNVANAQKSPANNEKPQASFRIDINAREQEQRKNTPLPYSVNNSNVNNQSQIIYQPDSIDDLDEEDPDDDLPF